MCSATKTDNRKNNIFILGKDPTQELEQTLTAEKMYSINCTEHNKKFCLSLHYNGANSLFVNGKETHKFKAKDSETAGTPFCLGDISKDWTVDNVKKKLDWMGMFMTWMVCLCFGLNGYVYGSADYDAIGVDDILDIHNYLIKKNDIV